MPQITFQRNVSFLGRNGYFTMAGAVVRHFPATALLTISPITSKGIEGRCEIEIPDESLPEFVHALLSAFDLRKRAAVLRGSLKKSKEKK